MTNTDDSVHWACAGLQDDSVPPDEWDCPDCEHKLTHGQSHFSIKGDGLIRRCIENNNRESTSDTLCKANLYSQVSLTEVEGADGEGEEEDCDERW